MYNLNLKKFFLYLLITSVSINAVLGIGVFLFGNLGETESKVIGTTFIITGSSILGLAYGATFEAKAGKVIPIIGIIFSIVSAVLWICMIWTVDSFEEFYFKLAGSTTLLAVAFSHLSLVSLAKLDKRFRWVNLLVYFSVGILSAILLIMIWVETIGFDFIGRIVGILTIGVASLTVMIPIFDKLSHKLDSITEIDEEIEKLQARITELEASRKEISNNL